MPLTLGWWRCNPAASLTAEGLKPTRRCVFSTGDDAAASHASPLMASFLPVWPKYHPACQHNSKHRNRHTRAQQRKDQQEVKTGPSFLLKRLLASAETTALLHLPPPASATEWRRRRASQPASPVSYKDTQIIYMLYSSKSALPQPR